MTEAPVSPRGCAEVAALRFEGAHSSHVRESLAVEEPLEIRLVFGSAHARTTRSIAVTMRTPGHDAELAVGFLVTEGVIRDVDGVVRVDADTPQGTSEAAPAHPPAEDGKTRVARNVASNIVTVELAPGIDVNLANLERNFYTTSSCGVCGKASLLALRAACPPRRRNEFVIDAATLYRLPERLRAGQGIFARTGGLHAAALFSADGKLDSMREDVGRHNAVDKLIGAALLADRLPLSNFLLLLSGRASFELVQKAVMGGIPMIASVGAPSSLAVAVAKEFDITLAGFLRDDHCNVYHGEHRVAGGEQTLS